VSTRPALSPLRPPASPRRLELADIFRAHGEAFQKTHRLTSAEHAVLRAVEICRTAALGGHTETCDRCAAVRIAYNSCRNRHCPKCQTLSKERWLAARQTELLPVDYFHLVFTLPHALNPLARINQRAIYDLLFQAVAETLRSFAHKHLGGEPGVTAILHTWSQTLLLHLHLHCLVTGGALAKDGSRWVAAKPGFLFPVRALSRVFQGKFLHALRAAFERGELRFPTDPARGARRRDFARLLRRLRSHPWVVYAKRPLAGPEQVLAYLGRYTHRVALSNDRLVSLNHDTVRFRWRDSAHGNRRSILSLCADEFIRRFLLHVLPKGFTRIRHFGLLANRYRKARLFRCRQLLGQPADIPSQVPESAAALMLRVTGTDILRCPVCHQGRMQIAQLLPAPRRLSWAQRSPDTS